MDLVLTPPERARTGMRRDCESHATHKKRSESVPIYHRAAEGGTYAGQMVTVYMPFWAAEGGTLGEATSAVGGDL